MHHHGVVNIITQTDFYFFQKLHNNWLIADWFQRLLYCVLSLHLQMMEEFVYRRQNGCDAAISYIVHGGCDVNFLFTLMLWVNSKLVNDLDGCCAIIHWSFRDVCSKLASKSALNRSLTASLLSNHFFLLAFLPLQPKWTDASCSLFQQREPFSLFQNPVRCLQRQHFKAL